MPPALHALHDDVHRRNLGPSAAGLARDGAERVHERTVIVDKGSVAALKGGRSPGKVHVRLRGRQALAHAPTHQDERGAAAHLPLEGLVAALKVHDVHVQESKVHGGHVPDFLHGVGNVLIAANGDVVRQTCSQRADYLLVHQGVLARVDKKGGNKLFRHPHAQLLR